MPPRVPVEILHWDIESQKYVMVSGVAPLPVGETGNNALYDAFQRKRVSLQGYRVDSTFSYDKQPLLFDEVAVGAGAATFDASMRTVYASTGGLAAGDAEKLVLRNYMPYTPGNSQQIIITGTANPDGADFTNVRAEIGYGDTINAIGFSYDEDGGHVFLRSPLVAGGLIEVDQADWDDPAADVDWTKSQIFAVDFQSLAVGRIRFLLDRNGLAVQVHEIYNDNLRVGPYWQLASLPPYWSIENTDIANEVCRLLAICVTVKSEGAPDLFDLPGYAFTASNRQTRKTVSTTLIPLLSISPLLAFKTLVNRSLSVPTDIETIADDDVFLVLVKNATLTNASFGAVHAESAMSYDVAATALSGGREVWSGYAAGGAVNSSSAFERAVAEKAALSINAAASAADILTLAAIRASSSDASVGASINFKEIR